MWGSHVPVEGGIVVIEWPDPKPTQRGQFVVAMQWASICGSDLHAIRDGRLHPEGPTKSGYPGHEGIGVVVESLSDEFQVGDVVLTIPRGELGGCFAEYQLLDDDHALHLSGGTDVTHLMMAQQYGTVLFAWQNFWPAEQPPRAAGTAVIHGAGSAGLFFVQEALRAGFERVICSDLNDGRLGVARELGATPVKIPDDDLDEIVADATKGRGADLVVDAVGTNAIRNAAIGQSRRKGVVGLYGLSTARVETLNTDDAFYRCVRLQFSVGAQAEPGLAPFREALRRIEEDEVRVDYCVGPTYDLAGVPEAIQCAAEQGRGAVKITIRLAG